MTLLLTAWLLLVQAPTQAPQASIEGFVLRAGTN
jgi:hypothetical protein